MELDFLQQAAKFRISETGYLQINIKTDVFWLYFPQKLRCWVESLIVSEITILWEDYWNWIGGFRNFGILREWSRSQVLDFEVNFVNLESLSTWSRSCKHFAVSFLEYSGLFANIFLTVSFLYFWSLFKISARSRVLLIKLLWILNLLY